MAVSSWTINWPIAVVMVTAITAFVILCIYKVIPGDVVIPFLTFCFGAAFPSQALATRVKTYYSTAPPPIRVTSDRPEPEKES
jgi:hypothetical protein